VVDWDGGWEEGLYCWVFLVVFLEGRGGGVPSTMDNPERRIGTREMVSGVISVVVYSYPRCVLLLSRSALSR